MRFSPKSVAAVYKQAVAEYQAECCGIVTGSAEVQHVHPLVNIQERLHAEDPEMHPRGPSRMPASRQVLPNTCPTV